ncbi:hypothetical protein CALVIDRAFT_539067 [Calocera viscosa TUFC12733]|uniref:Uncharacterized protein n=1 Tax=Calocera viscosa (strain TUFC12733) TaxID=1330018 RepID=A0A167K6F1_CALVF|nr:hypothetical protein CALVIDRAFT_539067 [Calocera viscosa TUFC12733]
MLVPLLFLFSILYLVVNLRPLYTNSNKATPPASPTPSASSTTNSTTPSGRRLDEAEEDMPLLTSTTSTASADARIGNLNLGRKPPQARRRSPPAHFPRQPQPPFSLSPAPLSHPRNLYRPPPRFSPNLSPNTTPSLSPSRSPSLPSGPGSGTGALAGPGPGDLASLKVEVESLRLQLADARGREEQALMQAHHLQQVLATLGQPAWMHHLPPQAHPQAQAHWLSPPASNSPQLQMHFSPPHHQQLIIPQPQYPAGYAPASQLQHVHPSAMGPYTVPPPPLLPQQGYPFPHTPHTLLSPPLPPPPAQHPPQATSPPHPAQQQQFEFADALTSALTAASGPPQQQQQQQQQSQPVSATSTTFSEREHEREREMVRQELFGAILRRPGVHPGLGMGIPAAPPVQPTTQSQSQSPENSNSLSLSLDSVDSISIDSLPTPLTQDSLADSGEVSFSSSGPVSMPSAASAPAGLGADTSALGQVGEELPGEGRTIHLDTTFSTFADSDLPAPAKPTLVASMTAPALLIQPSTPTAPTSPISPGGESGGSVYSQRSFDFQPAKLGTSVSSSALDDSGSSDSGEQEHRRHVTLHTSLPRGEQGLGD